MGEIRLALANEAEIKAFDDATGHSGVSMWHKDIACVLTDPLCKAQGKLQPKRTSSAYLVASETTPRMVQWYALHGDGWRKPFGSVMAVINDPREATP